MKIGNLILKNGFKKRAKENLKQITFFADFKKDEITFLFKGEKTDYKGKERLSAESSYEIILEEHLRGLDVERADIVAITTTIDFELKKTKGKVFFVDKGEKKILEYTHKV